MAKVVDQDIPSELLDLYRTALGEEKPDGGVQKRYPFRVPTMQTEVGHPSTKQRAQRARFLIAEGNFADVDWPTRQRWYAAAPEWGSFLWYYNYFIMSSLTGNANIPSGGTGVIKSIQVLKHSIPTTGGYAFTLGTEVDAAKSVIMIQGSARKVPKVYRGSGNVAVGGSTLALGVTVDPDKCTVRLDGSGIYDKGDPSVVNVAPYVSSLTTTQIGINWSRVPGEAAVASWEVTEHVEGVVHPVLVSVTNTVVTIDWAEPPDAAADASITVVEYI